MKKIGYLYSGRGLSEDEIFFRRAAKRRGVEPVLINISEIFREEDLRKIVEGCDVVYNSSAEELAIETCKTIEGIGKKVVDSSRAYYYIEDKWMFYLKCREHGILTPETILIAQDIAMAKKDLVDFGRWPVVLKRVEGCVGEFVDRAENIDEAEKIIKRFWEKGCERMPIIAQEFVASPSYRVTLIGGKIVQTAIKENRRWKATGIYAKRVKRFKVDDELKDIIWKIMKFVDIKVCGIDFLKKDGKWFAIEVNSTPGFDFFESERNKMADELVKMLKKI